jgi:hypothetical protein
MTRGQERNAGHALKEPVGRCDFRKIRRLFFEANEHLCSHFNARAVDFCSLYAGVVVTAAVFVVVFGLPA